MWFAFAFGVLGFLGLTGKMDCYAAIAAECGVSKRTVQDVIRAAERAGVRTLPSPWECWPPPNVKPIFK